MMESVIVFEKLSERAKFGHFLFQTQTQVDCSLATIGSKVKIKCFPDRFSGQPTSTTVEFLEWRIHIMATEVSFIGMGNTVDSLPKWKSLVEEFFSL